MHKRISNKRNKFKRKLFCAYLSKYFFICKLIFKIIRNFKINKGKHKLLFKNILNVWNTFCGRREFFREECENLLNGCKLLSICRYDSKITLKRELRSFFGSVCARGVDGGISLFLAQLCEYDPGSWPGFHFKHRRSHSVIPQRLLHKDTRSLPIAWSEKIFLLFFLILSFKNNSFGAKKVDFLQECRVLAIVARQIDLEIWSYTKSQYLNITLFYFV